MARRAGGPYSFDALPAFPTGVTVPYPTSEMHLRAAEEALGRTLPAALRERLLRKNGGDVEVGNDCWQLFPVWDPSDRRTVRATSNHILNQTETARTWNRFPPDAVAIGENGSGDVLILRRGSDDIELWNHETGEVESLGSLEM